MLSKIYNLLTNKGTTQGTPGFGLRCSVKQIFVINQQISFIHFCTENNTPCLLRLTNESFKVKNDISETTYNLSPWQKPEKSTDSILLPDDQMSVVAEIKLASSAKPCKDMLEAILASMKSLSYKAAILSGDFLFVKESKDSTEEKQCSEKVKIYSTNYHTQQPLLLVMVDLNILINDVTTLRLDKVYTSLQKLLQETRNKYWSDLRAVLTKCQETKILTNGKNTTTNTDVLQFNIQTLASHTALKEALTCFSNFNAS